MEQITTSKNPINWGLVSGVVYLDDHHEKTNGLFPLKIRLTYKHQRTYYKTGYSISKDDWERYNKNELRKTRIAIQNQMEVMGEHIEEMNKNGSFNFDLLAAKLGRGKKNDVFAAFEARIKDLKKNGQIGTSMIYECTLNSLKSFTGGKELPFEKITKSWLESYDESMKKDKATTTRSIYMRTLRAIINAADKVSPFGRSKNKFQIKNGGGRKLALTRPQINTTLMKHEVIPGSTAEKMRDLFYFSYLGSGMNVKDLILLKWSDIKNNEITFIRAKTARMNANEREISVPILPQMERIIDKWGDRESKYIFGYLDKPTPEAERLVSQNVARLMNKHLKKIATATGLPHTSSYSARFSYATNLSRSGAPIEYISGQLGHAKITTTQNYLEGFDSDDKMKFNQALTEE
jgi:integrase/recombinase XerD